MRHDDSAQVLGGACEAEAAHDVLLAAVLDVATARVRVILRERLQHLLKRDAIAGELIGAHEHLILLDQASEAVDVRNPGNTAQDRTHDPVLQRAQVHRVPSGALERVLIDLTQSGRDRSQFDVHAGRQLLARLLKPLEYQLPREVDVDVVLEHDRDDRKPKLRERADLRQARQAPHAHFDGIGHQLLDLDGCHPRRLGQDLDLNVGYVGERIDRQIVNRPHAESDEAQADEDDQQALAQCKDDEAVHSVTPRPSGSWKPGT